MLARQGPWQTCLCGGGEGQPLETLETPQMLLRPARVISVHAAALCTFRPRVQAQLRKAQPAQPLMLR